MNYLFAHRGASIGNRGVLSFVWLDSTGGTFATIGWTCLESGTARDTCVEYGFHSMVSSGSSIHTTSLSWDYPGAARLAARNTSPNHDVEFAAPGTSPTQVLRRHLERIRGRTDLVTFDQDSVARHVMVYAQEVYDRLCATGFFMPLHQDEVERLASVRPSVMTNAG